MASIRSRLVRFFLVKNSMRKMFDPNQSTLEKMRNSSIKIDKRIKPPQDSVVEKIMINGLKAEWLRSGSVDEHTPKILLYFHSGAFCLGYNNAHRDFAIRLSKASDLKVLAIDYRLAPENPYPAAIDDGLMAYQWLLSSGIHPENIILGGDSAGAGLVLMVLLAIKKAGDPMPCAAFLLSMFGGDLKYFDGKSYATRKASDPLNSRKGIQKFATIFLGDQVLEPAINADLSGLPNLFIQAGDDEILLSDSVRLAQSAKQAGINVTLDIWKDMWHVFQGFSMLIPEAKKAMDNLNHFIHNQFT